MLIGFPSEGLRAHVAPEQNSLLPHCAPIADGFPAGLSAEAACHKRVSHRSFRLIPAHGRLDNG